MIVSNIGVYPDLSAIYTTNASMDTAFVQTSLKEDHSLGSYEYMTRVRERLSREMPELTTYFQAGGLVDSVINQGLPAPIDVQVSSNDMEGRSISRKSCRKRSRRCQTSAMCTFPQDLNYPGLALNIDRERASLIGLSAKNVVDNVITALTSDGMVAPSYWIDPKTGNNYMVTVQYANRVINHMTMEDFENIPLRGARPPGYGPMQEGREAGDVRRPTLLWRPHRRLYAAAIGGGDQADQYSHGGGSLPDSPGNRHLRRDQDRGAEKVGKTSHSWQTPRRTRIPGSRCAARR